MTPKKTLSEPRSPLLSTIGVFIHITNEELIALRDLTKDTSVTFLAADKGRTVVVMNTNDYAEKVNNLLNDDKLLLQDNRQKKEPIIVQQKICQQTSLTD